MLRKKEVRKAVCVCPSAASFRAVETIARVFGYRAASEIRYDSELWRNLKNNPSKNGRYLLYLEPAKRLSWDHDGVGFEGKDILTECRTGKYIVIETSEALFDYLDNPPTGREDAIVPLNGKHTAIVTDNDVQVGCQIFTHAAVLKLAKEVESRQ